MKTLPLAAIPSNLSEMLSEVGRLWGQHPTRPRIDVDVRNHWDDLIQEWSESDLPLAIRKSGGLRGGLVLHCSGRKLITCGNSPAHSSFSRAFAACVYSIDEIRQFLERDEIPFTFATKAAEKSQMTFKCTLKAADNVNKRGWKLGHIDEVGLSTQTRITEIPIATLKRHFCDLLKPSNHFLIPLAWAGLGEVPEIIAHIRRCA